MRKRNPKDAQLAEAIAPAAHCDYEKFWEYVNNEELLIFLGGEEKYKDLLASCFPRMSRERALEYSGALRSLLE